MRNQNGRPNSKKFFFIQSMIFIETEARENYSIRGACINYVRSFGIWMRVRWLNSIHSFGFSFLKCQRFPTFGVHRFCSFNWIYCMRGSGSRRRHSRHRHRVSIRSANCLQTKYWHSPKLLKLCCWFNWFSVCVRFSIDRTKTDQKVYLLCSPRNNVTKLPWVRETKIKMNE